MREKLSIKDKITLATSVCAILLSILAFINSEIKGDAERKRTIRSQLTDVLSRIIMTDLENAKFFHDLGPVDQRYYQQLSSILNQHNAFLLQQAMYLSEQIPQLVTTPDLTTIAVANANTGDLILAEEFHKKAIEASPNDYYRSIAMRGYAIFLFPQRRFEEGREQFRKAVTLLKGGDNYVRFTNGLTYQIWGFNELVSGTSPHVYEDIFEKARIEFAGIDNQIMRENALQGLEAARRGTAPAGPIPAEPRRQQ